MRGSIDKTVPPPAQSQGNDGHFQPQGLAQQHGEDNESSTCDIGAFGLRFPQADAGHRHRHESHGNANEGSALATDDPKPKQREQRDESVPQSIRVVQHPMVQGQPAALPLRDRARLAKIQTC